MPPVIMNFSTPVVGRAISLAEDYIALNGTGSPTNFTDFNDFFPNEKFIFLQRLFEKINVMNYQIVKKIDQDFNLSNALNMEILWRWYRICIKVNYDDVEEIIKQFVGKIGRTKLVSPIYLSWV